MKYGPDSLTKTCTHDGCAKPLRAKGLCISHYNAINRTPNPTRQYICPTCATAFVKEAARANRYQNVYCSTSCREMHRWSSATGSWSVELPARHPARGWLAKSKAAPAPIPASECAWCGLTFQGTHRGVRNYCTRACKKRAGSTRRRALEFNAIGLYTWTDITKLWVAFSRQCAYCATPTSLPNIQAEHVVALSRGGANNLSNLLPSCGPCNSDKRDLTLAAWTIDRARRNLTRVNTTWSKSDPRYRHLTSATAKALAA